MKFTKRNQVQSIIILIIGVPFFETFGTTDILTERDDITGVMVRVLQFLKVDNPGCNANS